ncbi:dTDP-4-dehydro-6-deoxyglucose aminotransferase, partial [bacterium]
SENILARKYFYPGIHRMEPYKSYYPYSSQFLKNTEYLADRIISFPTGTAVDRDIIEKITNLVSFVHHNSDEIKLKLKGE